MALGVLVVVMLVDFSQLIGWASESSVFIGESISVEGFRRLCLSIYICFRRTTRTGGDTLAAAVDALLAAMTLFAMCCGSPLAA